MAGSPTLFPQEFRPAVILPQRLLESLKNDPYYVRVPAGTLFYLYVTQTVDLQKATTGLLRIQPNKPMKYLITILALSLCSACATHKPGKIQSSPAVAGIARSDTPGVRVPETVKAYPAGRYTDPNFPDEMHERHTVYRREQDADWNYRPSKP